MPSSEDKLSGGEVVEEWAPFIAAAMFGGVVWVFDDAMKAAIAASVVFGVTMARSLRATRARLRHVENELVELWVHHEFVRDAALNGKPWPPDENELKKALEFARFSAGVVRTKEDKDA